MIPSHDQSLNKSPVVVVEDKLAIESWCIKHVYRYANKTFIEKNNVSGQKDIHTLLEVTRVLIMVNPEYLSAWNFRKDMVKRKIIDPLEELSFTELILRKKPKSSEAFAHRRFLLTSILSSDDKTTEIASHETKLAIIDQEFKVCTETADKYYRNYYSWGHRLWLLQEVCQNDPEVIKQELVFTLSWIPTHVSEYSAFNYRQVLLTKMFLLLPSHEDRVNVIQSDCNWIEDMFTRFSGRESLFLYRRFLLQCVISLFPSQESHHLHENLKKHFLDKERDFLSRQFAQVKQYKNSWHLHLTRQHLKWIQKTIQSDSWTVKNAF